MRLIATSIALAAAAAVSGCGVPNEVSVQIVGAVNFDYEVDQEAGTIACLVPANADVYITNGILDVNYYGTPDQTPGLTRGFSVTNHLPETTTEGQLDTNDFIIERASISYTGLDDQTSAIVENLETQIPLGLTIPSGGDQGVPIVLVPSNVAQVLRDQLVPNPGDNRTIVANVRLDGHTGGQVQMSSSTLGWPINVCNGCTQGACGPDCACSHIQF